MGCHHFKKLVRQVGSSESSTGRLEHPTKPNCAPLNVNMGSRSGRLGENDAIAHDVDISAQRLRMGLPSTGCLSVELPAIG